MTAWYGVMRKDLQRFWDSNTIINYWAKDDEDLDGCVRNERRFLSIYI